MRGLMGLLAVVAVGCGGAGDPMGEPEGAADTDALGAAGAGSGIVTDDTEAPPASGQGGAGSAVPDHPCREFVAYQEAGGFWCSRDGVTVVETDTVKGCSYCYLVGCTDAPGIEWVPVECSSFEG